MPEEATSLIEIYNTETSEWSQYEGISRYRHAIVSVENTLYVHGGFEPEFASHPLETMVSLDISSISGSPQPLTNNLLPQRQETPSMNAPRTLEVEEPAIESTERVDRMMMSRGVNDNSRRELR